MTTCHTTLEKTFLSICAITSLSDSHMSRNSENYKNSLEFQAEISVTPKENLSNLKFYYQI